MTTDDFQHNRQRKKFSLHGQEFLMRDSHERSLCDGTIEYEILSEGTISIPVTEFEQIKVEDCKLPTDLDLKDLQTDSIQAEIITNGLGGDVLITTDTGDLTLDDGSLDQQHLMSTADFLEESVTQIVDSEGQPIVIDNATPPGMMPIIIGQTESGDPVMISETGEILIGQSMDLSPPPPSNEAFIADASCADAMTTVLVNNDFGGLGSSSIVDHHSSIVLEIPNQ